MLTIRLKCRIINGNRPRRNQRGSENAKERKSKECHERDIADGVRKLSTTRSLKVKLGAPGSKESRIVGKKMALEKRHVSSFIAAEHNKTMRLVTGVRRTKEGGPPQWPIVGNCRRQPRGLSGYEVYPKCINIECVRVQHHKYKTNI